AMSLAVRAVSVDRGIDPRDTTLIAFGGAGPLHAVAIAREISIPRVVIPKLPGNFSALGMLMAEWRHDFVRTLVGELGEIRPADGARARTGASLRPHCAAGRGGAACRYPSRPRPFVFPRAPAPPGAGPPFGYPDGPRRDPRGGCRAPPRGLNRPARPPVRPRRTRPV